MITTEPSFPHHLGGATGTSDTPKVDWARLKGSMT